MTALAALRPRLQSALLGLLVILGWPSAGMAAEDDEALGFERTPPRLSLTDGEVSFWRSGAEDWAPARVNIPLAEGDELYTGKDSNLEIQIGSRAYARAGEETQLGLTNLEPDYLQIRVARGVASLDVRSLPAAHTLEIDTPNAAFTIEHSGYYRVEVDGDTTHFSSRRGGYASMTAANGATAAIAPSEQLVISGTEQATFETYAAPELDGWDRWNYERTDQLIDALSSRYVPPGVYGADDLDHYGDWRVVPSYGAVWFPRVAVGWVPYSTGRWLYDPFYGWTWVDDAPWGWAPFHYGRWVFTGGYWAWAPGPRVVRTYYAPALVAFYSPGFSIRIGAHPCGWVALGWGEPIVPWWGPAHWRRSPHWAGWGGPRIVNNVVVHNTTVIDVNHISGYANASHRGAIVAVDRRDFGRRDLSHARLRDFDARKLRPAHGDFDVKPSAVSLVGSERAGRRPPRADLERAVVATREPRRASAPAIDARNRWSRREQGQRTPVAAQDLPARTPPARVVTRERTQTRVPERPPFGRQSGEERAAPPRPPRYRDARRQAGEQEARRQADAPEGRGRPGAPRDAGATRSAEPEVRDTRGERARGRAPVQGPQRSAPATGRAQTSRDTQQQPGAAPGRVGNAPSEVRGRTRTSEPRRELPGEPANRVFRGRGAQAPPAEVPAQAAPPAPSQTRGSTSPGKVRSQGGQERTQGGQGSRPQGSRGESGSGWGRRGGER
jgi:hypothetical protein